MNTHFDTGTCGTGHSGTDVSRRQLLAMGAAASLAAGPARTMAQEAKGQPLVGNPYLPEPVGQRMRWAIVGLGTFAVGQVIPGFVDASKSRMTAFISGNADKARKIGGPYGVANIYSYDNYDAIADDPEIDCVYIALPVGLHAEYTIRALNAGKHVLCEKPMASTSAECEAMIAAAQRNNRRLGVAYRIHFEPTNIAAKRRIDEGDLGMLRHIRCDHGFDADPAWPPHKWRLEKTLAGGGSMFDIGIYGLNTSLMMIENDRPVSASALYAFSKEDPRFSEVEGGMDWRLTMASGAIVTGSSSYCYRPYTSRQHYLGSEASAEMQPATTYYDNSLTISGDGPATKVGTALPIAQFPAQIDGFTEAVREERPHRTPGEMGLRDIRIVEALYRSADANGTQVQI